MKIKFQKTMNIASELLAYCHQHGATEFHLDIKETEGAVSLELRASPETLTEDQLEVLTNSLNAPRQREVEQQFWELIGETDATSELSLTGMLCDDAEVEYANNILTIRLTRLD